MKMRTAGYLALSLFGIAAWPDLQAAPGQLKWEFLCEGYRSQSLLAGDDGTVYVGTQAALGGSGRVYAVDGTAGQWRWDFRTANNLVGPPAVGIDGAIYVVAADGVYGLDAATGRKRWAYTNGENFLSCPAVGADGTVYVGAEQPGGLSHKRLYALEGTTGAKKWESRWDSTFTESGLPTELAIGADGTVYVNSGVGIYSINGASGEPLWQFHADRRIDSTIAILSEGTIFAGGGSRGQSIVCLEWIHRRREMELCYEQRLVATGVSVDSERWDTFRVCGPSH